MIDDELTMAKCSVNSTKTNAYMNNFAEMKRLEFGVNKCQKIHVGKSKQECDILKVHNEKGEKVDFDKYIGDILSNDGTNERKIQERCEKGYGLSLIHI